MEAAIVMLFHEKCYMRLENIKGFDFCQPIIVYTIKYKGTHNHEANFNRYLDIIIDLHKIIRWT